MSVYAKPVQGSTLKSGVTKTARLFNGTSDYLKSSANIDLTSTQIISLAFRMKWDNFTTDDHLAMETSSNFNSNVGAFIIDPNSPANFQVAVLTATSTYFKFGCSWPTANVWHDYLIVIDMRSLPTLGSSAIYIDGVSQSVSLNNINSPTPVNFGSYVLTLMSRDGSTLFAGGQMCDLAIWKADESSNVATIRNYNTNIAAVDSSNLLYYWKIGQASPDTATVGSVSFTVAGTTVTSVSDVVGSLIGCWLMNDGLKFSDIASSQPVASLVGTPLWAADQNGAYDSNGGGGSFTVTRSAGPSNSNSPITIMALVNAASVATTTCIIDYGGVTDSNDDFSFGVSAGALGIGTGGFPNTITTGTLTLSASTWSIIGVSQASTSARRFFKDGSFEVNSTAITTNVCGGGLSIGCGYTATTQNGSTWNGKIAWIYVWNRALSDAEMTSVYSDPNQLFATPVGLIVQNNTSIQNSGSGSVASLPYTQNVVAGNLLVATIKWSNTQQTPAPTIASVTDTLGNTGWTIIPATYADQSDATNSDQAGCQMAYCVSAFSGANTVSISMTMTGTIYLNGDVFELANFRSAPLDIAHAASGTTETTKSAGAVTPTTQKSFAITIITSSNVFGAGGTFTPATPWLKWYDVGGGSWCYTTSTLGQSGTASIDAATSQTLASYAWAAAVVVFSYDSLLPATNNLRRSVRAHRIVPLRILPNPDGTIT